MALVSYGADVREQDEQGDTIIHTFIKLNRIDLLEEVIRRGADVNGVNSNNEPPLHLSLELRSMKIARIFILHEKTNLEARNNKGETALHIATRQNMKNAILLICARGVPSNSKDNDGNTPEDVAYFNGFIGLAKYFRYREEHPFAKSDE